jgi:hypothetical protein
VKKLLVIILVVAVSVAATVAVQKYVLESPGVPGEKKIATAEKNSFNQVTRNLDPGGSFYMYLSTEKIIKKVREFIVNIKEMALKEAKEDAQKKLIEQIAHFVTMLLNDSGLFEVSGVGISSVAMENGFNHGKMVLHHYKDEGQGLMWNLLQSPPHVLDSQKLLPGDTVFADFSDCGLPYLWEWLNKEAATSGIPELKKGIAEFKLKLESNGIDLDAILGSLGGQWGFIVTFDESKKSKLPLMGKIIEIPDPAFALVLYVKDEVILNLLEKISRQKAKVEGDVKTLAGPQPMGAPITLEPLIVQKGNLLLLASNSKIADDIFAGQGGADGLTTGEEFKNLSLHMPKKGNNYTFLSSKIFKTVTEIQKKAMEMSGGQEKAVFSFIEKLNIFPEGLAVYSVMQNTAEGFVFSSNNNLPIGSAALLPAIAAGGVVAAIAIPNFIAAKKKSAQKATMGDMKSFAMAVETYMLDNGFAPQVGTMAELKKLLEPFYIKKLPLKDGWGFEYHYTHGVAEQQDTYSIGSGGKDGVFEGFDQTGFYDVIGEQDFAQDIIISNGDFVYGPRIK